LHLLEFAGLLDAAQRRDDGIKQEQQQVGAIVVEEQVPIAGAVACRADGAQALEQRQQAVEVFQTTDVAFGRSALLRTGHAPMRTLVLGRHQPRAGG
jgi:hypothetical protein